MSHQNEPPIFDSATLEQLRELVDQDDFSFLHDLFESYLATARDSIRSLRTDQDLEVLRRAAHTLKGSSLNVGATRVAELCRHLESDLRDQVPGDLQARVAQVEERVQQVHDGYGAALAKLLPH
jgi:HPt (histidine-containing phosphotransfer) domain-containing protein